MKRLPATHTEMASAELMHAAAVALMLSKRKSRSVRVTRAEWERLNNDLGDAVIASRMVDDETFELRLESHDSELRSGVFYIEAPE